jgi:hypothetical protein
MKKKSRLQMIRRGSTDHRLEKGAGLRIVYDSLRRVPCGTLLFIKEI